MALVPPAPEQLREYVVVVVGDTDTEPEVKPPVVKLPLVHDVALADDQVRVELPPEAMLVGAAVNEDTVAAGGTTGRTVTVTLRGVVPFPFVQLYW